MSAADPATDIGARLQRERRRLRLTKARVAAQLMVTRQTIWRAEKGRGHLDTAALRRLAALGFDIQYLVCGVRSENPDGACIAAWASLSASEAA